MFALISLIERNPELLILSYICTLIHPSLFLIGVSLPCEGYFEKHKAKVFYRGRPGSVD